MAEAYRSLPDACQVLSRLWVESSHSRLALQLFRLLSSTWTPPLTCISLNLCFHGSCFDSSFGSTCPRLCILQVSPYLLCSLTASTLDFHESRRGGGISGSLLPSNPTPLLTLESGSCTTCLQLTSLCHPCRVYVFFIFSALWGFLYPICYFCPFVLLLMFLIGPRMYSSIPLYSWENPAPPSGPSEMRWLWWSSIGFTPSWTDRPSASFQLSGAVNFCHGSLLPWFLLQSSQTCLIPTTRMKAHKSRDYMILPFVSLSDPSSVTSSVTSKMVSLLKMCLNTTAAFYWLRQTSQSCCEPHHHQAVSFSTTLYTRRGMRPSCRRNSCHFLSS